MKYFEKFPVLAYDFSYFNHKMAPIIITDCMVRLQPIVNEMAEGLSQIVAPYYIRDGETPEIVAHKLYGKVHYHWTIFLVNNIWDMAAQWPLDAESLMKYIKAKYGNTGGTVRHHVSKQGFVVDAGDNTIPVTDFDVEYKANEEKRKIVVVRPQFIESFVSKFEDKLREVKENYGN